MQSKTDRMDEARELFQQAANCYKLSKQWENAVAALMRCVECTPPEDDRETGGFYQEAANCIKNVNTNKYLEYSRTAIDKFCLSARIGPAATMAKQCAEQLEEDHDYEEAIQFYEKAAELYQADETPTQANQLLVKASDLLVLTREYSKLSKAIRVI
jgi:alpha-soluble NSF attachment protein